MHVPLIDLSYRLASVREELDAAIARVIDRGAFVLGPELEALEATMADLTGAQHAVGCASGSDALLLALMTLGVGPGDQVIVPSLTFISTATAVSRLGAEVVFADVDARSLTLDPASVEVAARSCTALRAVVQVHLFGYCPDGAALRAVADRYGAALVHDAAQSLGGDDPGGSPPGASGELTAFSFYPTKNLGALGDAGLVTTSDPERAATIQSLRAHGTERIDRPSGIGFNSRLDELQAAALQVLLPGLGRQVAARNAIADDYDELFASAGAHDRGLEVPHRPSEHGRHAFHHYVVRVPGDKRDALAAALAERGVETGRYYRTPLHRLDGFQPRSARDTPLPETERAARETLALPVHPGVGAPQRRYVVEQVLELLGE